MRIGLTSVAVLTTLTPFCGAQEQEIPTTEQLLQRYRALSEDSRRAVTRSLERKIQLDSYESVQRIVSETRSFKKLPLATPAPIHDAKRWTKGVAPDRQRISTGSPTHDRIAQRFPYVPFLSNLHKAVWYDWQRGEVVRREEPLSPEELFENLANGFPPGADFAVARVLARLDDDKKQRRVASYLGHLYANLNAQAFDAVTLYRAWYSTGAVDIPDVDAIPFAVNVLRNRSFRSPIPPNSKRARLYGQIRQAYQEFRVYRTTIEGAAAAWVAYRPEIDPTYDPLVPRFHFLWAEAGHNLDALAKTLGNNRNRQKLLSGIDARLKKGSDVYAVLEGEQGRMNTLAHRMRLWCDVELRRLGN